MGQATRYPFLVSTLVWERHLGTWSFTVCLKATYALQHGQEAALAPQQDGIHDDIYWDNNPQASLYSASDFAPLKPHSDVLLVGHACAPGGAPVERLNVRVAVGDFSKSLRVTGDRVWAQRPEGLRPSATRPFTQMPLRHERAAHRGENLGGLPLTPTEPGKPLPNIDAVDEPSAGGTPGFAPLPPRWRAARNQVSSEAVLWASRLRSGAAGPAPLGLDFDFFNAAPRDQQLDRIPAGAPLVLENLHRQIPRLETRLPSLVPKVFYVNPLSGRRVEVAMCCDTLWIDVDRAVAVVSWRGVISSAPPAEQAQGSVLVAAHAPTEQVSYEDVARLFQQAPAPQRQATMAIAAIRVPMVTPFPIAKPGSAPPPPLEPIPGAPWAISSPHEPTRIAAEPDTPTQPIPLLHPAPPAALLALEPPAVEPPPPEPPRVVEKPAPPAGSPWKVEEPPSVEIARAPAAPPRAATAVKSSLYEDFRSKKR